MSGMENIRFNEEEEVGYPRVLSKESKVDLNHLMKRVKEEEKRSKRNNLAISAAAISVVIVFGVVLTL
jgi:hypothetical protein